MTTEYLRLHDAIKQMEVPNVGVELEITGELRDAMYRLTIWYKFGGGYFGIYDDAMKLIAKTYEDLYGEVREEQ